MQYASLAWGMDAPAENDISGEVEGAR